jgi:hypothetical protein
MACKSGIELEAITGFTMEQQKLPGSMIEEELRHLARFHLKLDLSAQGEFDAFKKPNEGLYEIKNYDDTFKRRMRRFKNDTSRSVYRLNLFQVPHFKTWINPKQKINLVGIGGESPGKDFKAYKTYVDERLDTDLEGICLGMIKVYPVGEINNRLICILKEDVHTRKKILGIQTVTKVYVPREGVFYLFYLHLVQKEGLRNIITRYRREDLVSNSGSYLNWEDL